jgi:hypothetical protein
MLRRLLLGLLLALLACEPPLAIEGAREITPDPAWGWRTLYDSAEACVGIEGDYDRLRWFAVDRITGEDGYAGYWKEGRIYLLPTPAARRKGIHAVDEPFKPLLVQHEMIHDLLHGDGAHEHPAWDRCDPIT